MELLKMEHLTTSFAGEHGWLNAVEDVKVKDSA